MATVRVTLDGQDDAIAALGLWMDRIQSATGSATANAGDELQSLARANFVGVHPPGFPHAGGDKPNIASGDLQLSILPSPVASDGRGIYTVLVGPTTIYGRIIELGGVITPTEARYLSWFSPWLNRRMYREEVTLTGWPYLKPALNDLRGRINGIYENEWTAATVE